MIKNLCLAIIIALVGGTFFTAPAAQNEYAYVQKRDKGDGKKKEVPGPPVVNDKKPKESKPKDGKRGKKPD
jgi:hypothetical protein